MPPKIIPDETYQSIWRVRWPDGKLSDMANLTRAKDAAACFMESEARRLRGRQRPVGKSQSDYSAPEGIKCPPLSNGLTGPSSHFAN